MTNEEIAIRKALEAGPTPGPWSTISRGRYWHEEEADVLDSEGADITQAEFVKPVGDVATTRGQMYRRDAEFIVACDPTAMRALLAEVDLLRQHNAEPAAEAVAINGEPATAHSLLAALVDIHDDDQKNAPEHRCYVESAWGDCMRAARAFLAAQT